MSAYKDSTWKSIEEVISSMEHTSQGRKPGKSARTPGGPPPPSPELPRQIGIGRGAYMREIEREYCAGYTNASLRSELRQSNAYDYSNEGIMDYLKYPRGSMSGGLEKESFAMEQPSFFQADKDSLPLIQPADESLYVKMDGLTLPDDTEGTEASGTVQAVQSDVSSTSSSEPSSLFSKDVNLKSRNALVNNLKKSKTYSQQLGSKSTNSFGDNSSFALDQSDFPPL